MKKTNAQLKKILDGVFSKFIRHKYAYKDGLVHCYTCTVSKPVKEMQNGHWIPRNILSTRFDEDNCRPQCVGCNMFQKGRPDVFAVNLLNEYGQERLKALQKNRQETIRYFPYEEKIEHYTNRLKEYEKK